MRFAKLKKLALGIGMFVMSGCGASPSADSYMSLIWDAYPELRGKSYAEAIVERVIDGDTFVINGGHRVRLIGVNTPEITNGKNEAYGLEAKQFTTERLLDKEVVLIADVGDTDRYGRLLRYVFMKPEPEMFNELLLKEGYANTMTVPPNVTYAERFVSLEREARENNRGLWGEDETATLASCDEPLIKGNINSKNERIYHVPGSRYYDSTVAEVIFCTVEEAEAAGFRAPLR